VPIKLLALILPLSLDTFAVAAALGVAGLDRRERLRLSLVLAGFEAVMPLAGFLVGAAVGSRLGDVAGWLAVGLLAAVGVYLLLGPADDLDGARLRARRGWSMVGLGLSVSIDELAIGLAVGLTGLPILLVIGVIAAQAFIATQVGTRLGARVGERLREGAERLAGALLVVLAAALALARVTGHGG
jgi:putative Mn2+ efflux pump MntP